MSNFLIGQSGGPTSVINATLAGVIGAAIKSNQIDKVYGAVHGIEGVKKKEYIDLTERFASEKQRDLLIHTPASFLGSCRYKLKCEDECAQIFSEFQRLDIGYFFYIGGNDSMDTVDQLSKYALSNDYDIKIIGIPKTIDNDLAVTDHTPGFGSAAKYIATTMREVSRDSAVYDKPTVTLVEIMGRNAGWLAAASILARSEADPAPHLVYLPEYVFDLDNFIEDLKKTIAKHRNAIVAISEGVKTSDGKYVCEGEISGDTDAFGHKTLTGTAHFLSTVITKEIPDAKVRSIELSLMQRCGAHVASLVDVQEAEAIGIKGVEAALAGETAKMMYFKRVSDSPYKVEICSEDVSKIANVEKMIPKDWIDERGQKVSDELINYMLPLIQGEAGTTFENGLPIHAIK